MGDDPKCCAMHASVDEQISKIPKSRLRSNSGLAYSDFKRDLKPLYWRVWRDILLGHVGLIIVSFMLIKAQSLGGLPGLAGCLIGAVFFGYGFAYLNLFFHEAVHRNLAPSARWNDWLADWLIGIFFGQSIVAYRTVHFGHHQHHGTTMDTEHSYFDPLNTRFFLLTLFGVRAFHVAREREQLAGSVTDGSGSHSGSKRALAGGLLLNGSVVICSLALGYWALAGAWVVGLVSIYPFLNALRQLLEHRDEFAGANVRYVETAHGKINRLFGDGLLAQTLGGAGFNRHLLHHWEPQLSYTRLKEIEGFVLDSEYGHLFQQRKTTYRKAFLELLAAGRQ